MVEVRGLLISTVGSFLVVYKEKLKEIDDLLYKDIGKHWNELDPNQWYDVKHYNNFLKAYSEASITHEKSWITFGRNLFPAFWKAFGNPEGLKTTLDYIDWEAKYYNSNMRGKEFSERKFIKKEDGHVIMQMDGKERNCLVSVGVYESLMAKSGAKGWAVKQTKCVKKGDPVCEFEVTWQK